MARIPVVSLEELAGVLLDEAMLLLDGTGALLEEDAGVLLEETGAVSSSFGT